MEEYGNWFYVVAIVAIGLFNLLKGKKREVEEILPEQPDDWSRQEEATNQSVEPDAIPVRKKTTARTAASQPPFTTQRGTVAPIRDRPITEMVEEPDENGIDLDLDSSDELRRGIIYSEIFGRKY